MPEKNWSDSKWLREEREKKLEVMRDGEGGCVPIE